MIRVEETPILENRFCRFFSEFFEWWGFGGGNRRNKGFFGGLVFLKNTFLEIIFEGIGFNS